MKSGETQTGAYAIGFVVCGCKNVWKVCSSISDASLMLVHGIVFTDFLFTEVVFARLIVYSCV